MRTRRAATIVAIVAVVAIVIALSGVALARTLLGAVVSAATGYDVSFGRVQLGWSNSALFDVHVARGGDPVLDAQRVDLRYNVRDLFPGGTRRFGVVDIAIAHPLLTIVRHTDGSYNVGGRGASGPAPSVPAPTKAAASPLIFDARVRNGTVVLLDQSNPDPSVRRLVLDHLDADAAVKSDERSTYRASATLAYTGATFPLVIAGTVDLPRAYALHRLHASRFPLRPLANYLLNSQTTEVTGGILHDVDVRAYALGIDAQHPIAYSIGGSARLDGGILRVPGLRQPITALAGTLDFASDGLTAKRLDGKIGGVNAIAAGGLIGLHDPQFRLALHGAGDLHDLRGLFAFAAREPIRGDVNLGVLIEGPVAQPLILVDARGPAIAFDRYPIDAVAGTVAVYKGSVVIAPMQARYGPLDVRVAGRLVFDPGPLDVLLAVNGAAAAAQLPYLDRIAPDAQTRIAAFVTGTETKLAARGVVALAGPISSGGGFLSVNPDGRDIFGPLVVERGATSVAAGARIDRTVGTAAFWADSRDFLIAPERPHPPLPGLELPVVPAFDGALSASLAGFDPGPGLPLVAGVARAHDARLGTLRIANAQATFGGTFAALHAGEIVAEGPFGTFRGVAAVEDGGTALEGDYQGGFAQLRPFTGDLGANGSLAGPVALLLGKETTVVQARGVRADARVHGVPVSALSGTFDAEKDRVQILAAQATLAGTEAVGRGDTSGGIAVAVAGLPAAPLAAAGLPLDAGTIAGLGVAVPQRRGLDFDGSVAVTNGSVAGLQGFASAGVRLRGDDLRFSDGLAGSSGAVARGAGTVALGHRPAYDVRSQIVGLRSQELVAAFAPMVPYPEGRIDADVQIRGSGQRPLVRGVAAVPHGAVNGLGFDDLRSDIAISPGRLVANHGTVAVGSTRMTFAARANGDRGRIAVDAPHADLGDFNNFFNDADVLGGTGRISGIFNRGLWFVKSYGDVSLSGFRYRNFALGALAAHWGSADNVVRGSLDVSGPSGSLAANGSMTVPAAATIATIFPRSRYDVGAAIGGLDLGLWLPLLGVTYPLTGRVDAQLRARGRWPALALDTNARVTGGTIAGLPVDAAELVTRTANGRTQVESGHLDLPFLSADVTGSFGLSGNAPLELAAAIRSPDLGRLATRVFDRPIDAAGDLDGSLRVHGSFARPALDGGFDVHNARYAALRIPRIIGSASYAGRSMSIRDAEFIFDKGSAIIAGTVPLELQPLGIGPPASPLSFDLGLRGLDLASFDSLLPPGSKLGGVLDGQVNVAGTAAAPRLFGRVALERGSFVGPQEQAPITGASATLGFDGSSAHLEAVHASLGNGSLDGSGDITFPQFGGSAFAYDVQTRLRSAKLASPEYGRGTLDGTLDLRRGPADSRASLRGALALTDAVIPFNTLYNPSPPDEASSAAAGAAGSLIPGLGDLGLDLDLRAGRNVRVYSGLVDIGATGSVAVGGTLAEPRLAGIFRAQPGGTLTYANRVLRVQDATVTFHPDDGIVPRLDATATAHVSNADPDLSRNLAGTADITLHASGPATSLAFTLSSSPPYSESQILALLLNVPALGGGFNTTVDGRIPSTGLRGAPDPNIGLLPPGVLVSQPGGGFSLSQEAFSLLNAQATRNLLSPLETAFGGALGLSDVALTFDYGGGIGFSARKLLGKDVYAIYSQTLTYPLRQTIGFEARPNDATAIALTFFTQQITYAFGTTAQSQVGTNPRFTAGQPVGGTSGFSLNIQRLFP